MDYNNNKKNNNIEYLGALKTTSTIALTIQIYEKRTKMYSTGSISHRSLGKKVSLEGSFFNRTLAKRVLKGRGLG